MPICPRCGKTLSSDQALTYHLNRKYKCGTWKCFKCSELFDTKFALNIHSNTCDQQKYIMPSYDILQNIYINMNSHIFIEIDCKNIIHTISPNCEDILGYKQKDLIGQDITSVLRTETSNTDRITFENKQHQLISAKQMMITDNLYVYSLC